VTAHVAEHALCHVVVVNPRAGALGAGAAETAPRRLWEAVTPSSSAPTG
jgi:hypothetical protein